MKKLCKMETYADGNGDSMKFTKMHGIGNDYVYVNCFTEQVRDPEQVSCRISDRHFGIGSDGLVLIRPSSVAVFRHAGIDGSLLQPHLYFNIRQLRLLFQ